MIPPATTRTSYAKPGTDVDDESWLSPSAVKQRREKCKIDIRTPAAWCKDTEFISLGCHCLVTRALEALGLKSGGFPFDWMRSPLHGVIDLIKNDFKDLLSYSMISNRPVGTLDPPKQFLSCAWGGSFWHEDPRDPKTVSSFQRKAQRFYGMRPDELPSDKRRCFVRVANSMVELNRTIELYEELCKKLCDDGELPREEVYLLLIVDLQEEHIPLGVRDYDNIIIYRRQSEIFHPSYANWNLALCCEEYAQMIAFAVRYWSKDVRARREVDILETLEDVIASCDDYDAGPCETDLYWPRPYAGTKLDSESVKVAKSAISSGYIPQTINGRCVLQQVDRDVYLCVGNEAVDYYKSKDGADIWSGWRIFPGWKVKASDAGDGWLQPLTLPEMPEAEEELSMLRTTITLPPPVTTALPAQRMIALPPPTTISSQQMAMAPAAFTMAPMTTMAPPTTATLPRTAYGSVVIPDMMRSQFD